jgi:phage shock protein PspC (stress-responsive transcriptional regulator)
MPSLIRLIVVLAVIAGAVYGGMLALVLLVEPNPREMSVRIPNERLQP